MKSMVVLACPFHGNLFYISTMFVMFALPLTTPIRPRNALGTTCIKNKHTNAFLLMIETTKKTSNILLKPLIKNQAHTIKDQRTLNHDPWTHNQGFAELPQAMR